MYSKRSQTRFT